METGMLLGRMERNQLRNAPAGILLIGGLGMLGNALEAAFGHP
jgi:hypothetical protein